MPYGRGGKGASGKKAARWLHKQLVAEVPVIKKVVKNALMDSMKGKRISVYGPWMKAFYVLCQIVPHEILMGFINW